MEIKRNFYLDKLIKRKSNGFSNQQSLNTDKKSRYRQAHSLFQPNALQ